MPAGADGLPLSNTSLLLVDHALSEQSESCKPSQGKQTHAHFCVQLQGVEHVLIKAHEAQVKDRALVYTLPTLL